MIVITVPAWFAVTVALGVAVGIYKGVKENIDKAKKEKSRKSLAGTLLIIPVVLYVISWTATINFL